MLVARDLRREHMNWSWLVHLKNIFIDIAHALVGVLIRLRLLPRSRKGCLISLNSHGVY